MCYRESTNKGSSWTVRTGKDRCRRQGKGDRTRVIKSTVKGCSKTVEKGGDRNRRRDEGDRTCVLERARMKAPGQSVKVKIGTEDEVKETVYEAGKSYLYSGG